MILLRIVEIRMSLTTQLALHLESLTLLSAFKQTLITTDFNKKPPV